MEACGVPVIRCRGGEPIIAPTERWWETGVTFNAAAVYLERSPANAPIIRGLLCRDDIDAPELADGVVAIHYRARPEIDPGSPRHARSFVGLAVFTPELEPLYRWPEPVMYPAAEPDGFDALGVEDPRITRIGDLFYMVYCGLESDPDPVLLCRPRLCLAVSPDLLHWQKLGPMPGDINATYNKDGVLFPDPIDRRYYLLHPPFWYGLPMPSYVMHLAVSDSLSGPWEDCGELLRAYPNPAFVASWVGAGSVPIPLGDKRYLVIYHTGNYLDKVNREYDLDAAIFDFNRLAFGQPDSLVASRLEPLMVPETATELHSRSRLQVANVLFACGSYEYRGDIYIVYGGADTYTLAARIDRSGLVDATARAGLENPFLVNELRVAA